MSLGKLLADVQAVEFSLGPEGTDGRVDVRAELRDGLAAVGILTM